MTHQAFDLSSFLPYRLAVLAERVSRRLAAEYQALHGLSIAEWRVMVHLLHSDEVSIRDICDYANLDKPKASRAVKRLEKDGLVEKRSGAKDGRLVAISLTNAGRRVIYEILPAAKAVEANLLGALQLEEQRALARTMEKLHSALDLDPAAKPRTLASQGPKTP
ncbi:MAG: MarR family winged helix-turn-helix transcriptional regulator [Pseudomonadota bacterium]